MNEYKKYYRQCIQQDGLALYADTYKKRRKDIIYRFQKMLRRNEYFYNMSKSKRCVGIVYRLIFVIYNRLYNRQEIRYGFSIPLNVFGPGLSIAHYGTIVVATNAKIGENCRIHEGVTIGATGGSDKAPVIGKNVFIGSGAKIIGEITIADNVAIGANACVVTSITEPGTSWGGVPAKKISNNDSLSNISKLLHK